MPAKQAQEIYMNNQDPYGFGGASAEFDDVSGADSAPETAEQAVEEAAAKGSAAKVARAKKSKEHMDLTSRTPAMFTDKEFEEGTTSTGDVLFSVPLKAKVIVPKMAGRGSKRAPVYDADGIVMVEKMGAKRVGLTLTADEFNSIGSLPEVSMIVLGTPLKHLAAEAEVQGKPAVEGEAFSLRDVYNWYKTTEYSEVLGVSLLNWVAGVQVSAATAAAQQLCTLPEGIEQAQLAKYVQASLQVFNSVLGKMQLSNAAKTEATNLSSQVVALVSSGKLVKGARKPSRDSWINYRTKVASFLKQFAAATATKIAEAEAASAAGADTSELNDRIEQMRRQVASLDHVVCTINSGIASIDAAAAKAAAREAKKKAALEQAMKSSIEDFGADLDLDAFAIQE